MATTIHNTGMAFSSGAKGIWNSKSDRHENVLNIYPIPPI